jgi:hypothetical protein
MSKWFHIVNGKGYDWHYRRHPALKEHPDDSYLNDVWLFYLDDILVGQVFNSGRMGWGCFDQFGGFSEPLYGFKTRHLATSAMLQLSKKIIAEAVMKQDGRWSEEHHG